MEADGFSCKDVEMDQVELTAEQEARAAGFKSRSGFSILPPFHPAGE